MSQQDENEKLARWLGWADIGLQRNGHSQNELWGINPKIGLSLCKVPDFRTDEAANAMLLERMPLGFKLTRLTEWLASEVVSILASHKDRKTAVVLAALALIEKEEKREI